VSATTHPVIGELIARGPVITDGAWGTQLQALGLQPGEHPDFWNLSHPDRVREVAARYVASGSDIILTNTFRSNSVALASHGGGSQIGALNAAGERSPVMLPGRAQRSLRRSGRAAGC
jgi:5-methyltetrahydrofolate--homocysteine methyltransferase